MPPAELSLITQPSRERQAPPGISNFFSPEHARAIADSGALAVLLAYKGWDRIVLAEVRNTERPCGERAYTTTVRRSMIVRCVGTVAERCVESFTFIDDGFKAGLNDAQQTALGMPALIDQQTNGWYVAAFGDVTNNALQVLEANPYTQCAPPILHCAPAAA
ncbi:MAG TPA: hypothetical protein VFN56_01150 [Candidatus Saccharimonadales bacterium]|nr:hypothetical protein [Candidatus Saccharimonadales bacterium]